jgi:hypothetical protein
MLHKIRCIIVKTVERGNALTSALDLCRIKFKSRDVFRDCMVFKGINIYAYPSEVFFTGIESESIGETIFKYGSLTLSDAIPILRGLKKYGHLHLDDVSAENRIIDIEKVGYKQVCCSIWGRGTTFESDCGVTE